MGLPPDVAGRIAADRTLSEEFGAICDFGGRLAGTESEHQAMKYVAERGVTSVHNMGTWRQVAVSIGRILNGAKPADLPVVQSTKFDLVINAQTARMLGLTVPQSLLSTAEVMGQVRKVQHLVQVEEAA